MKKGYYTIDNSDLYWYYKPSTTGTAQVTLFYKKGSYKDVAVERSKNYVIPESRIQHWEKYEAG